MTDLTPRMRSPAAVLPEIVPLLQAYAKAAEGRGLAPGVLALAMLRTSQVNGCSVCVDGQSRSLRRSGESVDRLCAVAAWRDAPYFSPAERAALALAEAVTRVADASDPVPNAVWNEAARHFDERGLAALLVGITVMNTFNRLNVATRQLAGRPPWEPPDDAPIPGAAPSSART